MTAWVFFLKVSFNQNKRLNFLKFISAAKLYDPKLFRNRDGSGNPGTSPGLSLGVKNCNGQPGFFLWETLSAFQRLKGFCTAKKRLPKII